MIIAKRLLHILIGLISLLFSVRCAAQVRFTAVADQQQVAKDAIIKVEFIIDNASSIENFKVPSFKNFKVLSGPEQSNGMSLINGALSKYSSVAFVLQPVKTGKISIASATAVVNGKMMQSNPLLIAVGNYRSGNNQPVTVSPFTPVPEVDEQYELLQGEDVNKKIKDNIIVKLETDKLSCYEGEPVIAVYKLCSRLKSESRVTKRPSLNGFSVYDMVEPETSGPTIEKINGKPFNVHIIRKAQLYPLQPGVFELEPVELDNKIRFLKRQSITGNEKGATQQLVDEFLAGNQPASWEEHDITLSSKPVTITVKALPPDKPELFNGAVGNFTIEAEIIPNELHANETAVLRVTINGEGNLPLVTAPTVNFPKGFELYGDAAIKESIDKRVAPIHGSKTFEYSFIPADSGSYEMEPIALAFFDPSKGSYQHAETSPVVLKVLAAKIKNADRLRNIINKVPGTNDGMKWIWLAVSGVALLVLIWVITRARANKRQKELKNIVVKKDPANEQPVQVSVYPFQKARDAIGEEDHKEFYSALLQSLWTELSSRLQLPLSRLNRNTVTIALRQRGKDAAIIKDFELLTDECELALYTPVYTTGNRQEALDRAEKILAALRATVEY